MCIRIKDGETNTIYTKCVVQNLCELMWSIPKNISYVEREASGVLRLLKIEYVEEIMSVHFRTFVICACEYEGNRLGRFGCIVGVMMV